ncbi:hypothetical protein VNO77_20649 [Canavalia gladiata]|uniref:TRAPPC10/Trs130 N-terminal domain-containing protein n=1 Tax=Canavalia gladiata TaxID=3824 RepID=A0AAN9LPV5_CANGL
MQLNMQNSDFVDGIGAEILAKICSHLPGTICNWIGTINDIAHSDALCQIDDGKLALLWGAVNCYSQMSIVEANSSLLVDLVDAMDHLLTTKAGDISDMSKNPRKALAGDQEDISVSSWLKYINECVKMQMSYQIQTFLNFPRSEFYALAAWALTNVTCGTFEHTRVVIKHGICPRLVELQQHSSPAVLLPAKRTVVNIVAGDDAHTQLVIDNQVLPRLRQIHTQNHQKNILREVCWAVSNITAGNSAQVNDYGGADEIENLQYHDNHEISEMVNSTSCQSGASAIFFILKESLASMFEMAHRHKEALREYDELELCYLETVNMIGMQRLRSRQSWYPPHFLILFSL